MKCEKCGSEMKLQEFVYISDPVRYGYKCPKCGNVQYSMIKEENNQMDYEKKYKETIAWIDIIMPTLTKEQQEDALENFPELTENEDERIRKDIMVLIKDWWDRVNKDNISTKEQMLAWLERQGDQKPVIDFKAKNWYVSKVDGKIHDMTYNPTDKVEPKFKVGDWVVDNHGIVNQVTSTTDDGYGLALYDGTYVSGCWKDYYHLWTIQDAKDGDVLISQYGKPFIYNGNYNSLNIGAYCGITCDDNFKVAEEKCQWTENVDIKPSNKEQCDKLFKAMKEAGYEWNAEKKKLKRIKQELTESPKDYHDIDPHFGKTVDEFEEDWDSIKTLKFKGGDIVVNDSGSILEIVERNSYGYFYKVINSNERVNAILFSNRYEMEDTFHLWTIQDARDGDVLHSIGFHNDCIFIFNGLDNDGYREVATGYCCLFVSADKMEFGIQGPDGIEIDTVKPATQIQRDLLFQNMKESGYEWDDEKKELKKIEQKYTVKPIFSIGDVLCDKSCTTLDKNSQPNIEVRDIRNDMYICNNCSFPISQQDEYELVAKRIELQPAWSDEDEGMKENIEGALDCYEGMVSEDWEKEKEWLTSIKDRMQPQIKEWSEEDDRIYYSLLADIRTRQDDSTSTLEAYYNEQINWIKSLKTRTVWKPNEKQIQTFKQVYEWYNNNFAPSETLTSLYNDLKKL